MSARAADETLPWSRLEWSALDETARARALTRPVQVVAAATREAVAAYTPALVPAWQSRSLTGPSPAILV